MCFYPIQIDMQNFRHFCKKKEKHFRSSLSMVLHSALQLFGFLWDCIAHMYHSQVLSILITQQRCGLCICLNKLLHDHPSFWSSKLPGTGMMFVSLTAPYGFIWHLDFLIFTLSFRPYLLKVASSIALTVAPLSGNTVTLAPLISTF